MQAILAPILGPSGPYTADLSGKTAVVTGGALGIGFETSKWFAKMGAKVIMVNRKEEQGESAIEEIKAECSKEVEWIGCDLGDVKMVKEVFSGIREKLDRLDLVCTCTVSLHRPSYAPQFEYSYDRQFEYGESS
jgi:NAD(P)-dependent dehydrogenase (short-subunit alcohol dehydrogenase family)